MNITETEAFVEKNKSKILVLTLAIVGFITSPLISILSISGIAILFGILGVIEEREKEKKENPNGYNKYYTGKKYKKR